MALIDVRGAKARQLFLALAATAVASQSVFALPQAQSGGGRRVGSAAVRARSCVGCSLRDSLDGNRKQLLSRIDSLRWEVEHRLLSDSEREHVAREMARTILALESSIAESMYERATTTVGRARAAAEAQASSSAIAMAFESGYRLPGYLGVTFDGAMAEIPRPNNERVIRFYQYPRITLVEPSSPAERAGVLAGDTLLALNGDDVRQREISFTKLLVPDAIVTMRVQRDGDEKEMKVTVGRTPDYITVRRIAPMPPRAMQPSLPSRVEVYGVPEPRAAPNIYWFGGDGLAGARVETISEGLGKAIGVKSGVLVVRAAPGTPAYRSGLRDGDVVIRAAGNTVTTVSQLRRSVANGHSDRQVKLIVVRERQQRDVTLHW